MKEFLFLHGGPGMNSIAEQAILGPAFVRRGHSIHFWNEPSKLRPEGEPFMGEEAFPRWVESIQKKIRVVAEARGRICVLAHSFSVHAILRLMGTEEERISGVAFIAPCLRPFPVFRAIMEAARRDFSRSSPDKAVLLGDRIQQTRQFFDPAMQAGLMLAAEDSELFGNYWANPQNMVKYFEAWERAGAQMDIESLFSVCMGLARSNPDQLSFSKSRIPVRLIFGRKDPLIDSDYQSLVARDVFDNIETLAFEEAGHLPHLEQTEKFIDSIESLF